MGPGFLEMLGEAIVSEVAPAIVLCIAALLAMINLRNSDIASRHRENSKELLYKIRDLEKSEQKNRENSLRMQNYLLIRRYNRLGYAFILMSFVLIIFAMSLIFSGLGEKVFAGSMVLIAGGVSLFPIAILIVEFYVGHQTLELNSEGIRNSSGESLSDPGT